MSDVIIKLATESNLDQLSYSMDELAALNAEHEAEVEKLFTPKLREKWKVIDQQYGDLIRPIDEKVGELRKEIKEQTLKLGYTVTGESHQAVFNKGRESWSSKELDGYAQAHPEIKRFKKVGKESVSIKAVKKERKGND